MKIKIHFKTAFLLIVFLTLQSPLFSQTVLKTGTFGNGSSFSGSAGFLLKGIAGQPAIGKTVNSSFIIQSGFWHGAWYITDIDQPLFGIPSVFELYQNYPNPFNPTTTIKYDLPVASNVKIEVYNLLGQKLVSLVDEEKPAGKYAVNFEGFNLASGVYFYSIETDQFTKVKRMLLTK